MEYLKPNLHFKEKINFLKTSITFKRLIVLFSATYLLATFNFLQTKRSHFHTAVNYSKDAINVVPVDYKNYNRSQKKMPLILYWTTFFGHEGIGFGLGHQPFIDRQCEVSNCVTSSNRSLINESDAVIFHIRDTELNDLPDPKFRKPHQHYIFYLYESPVHTYLNLKSMKGFFNWTMTYRLDSDFVECYARFTPVNSTHDRVTSVRPVNSADVQLTSVGQRKLALWTVSNCETNGNREAYIEELRRYVPVDVYGKCNYRAFNESRARYIYGEYKFYLAFENSLCKDYVTEKFYKILQYDLVPVCYGLGNYSAVGPPNSYIDARNYESPQKLAEYLLELDRNETAYNQYLMWKTKYKMRDVSHKFCELCKRLNGHNSPKIYKNIHNWWYNGAENSQKKICINKLPYNPI